ncbi:MAG: phosphatidylglycerol lysyltransferase domain-containing protein [Clostridia bacterium]|nr:phosphatidylglycerol lysyltransferase domain-containing protein [Clostridia bacterium]
MEFKKITLSDRDKLLPFLQKNDELTCEISFINLLLWQPLYNNCFCIENDILYLKSYDEQIETYSLPFGDMKTGVENIIAHSGNPYPTFWAQAGARFDEFVGLYGDRYDIIESRNEFDYIYNSSDLINLSGKKYHSKRNHISAFSKQFDWHYEAITADNIDKVRECADIWYSQSSDKMDDELKCEMQGVYMMLDNMSALHLCGGAIVVDDKIVAFTLGSAINKSVYNIHIEKAIEGFEAAYTVINREFAAHNCENYKYINREDDLGLEGLRKSKLSYKPQIILPKYVLTKKEKL